MASGERQLVRSDESWALCCLIKFWPPAGAVVRFINVLGIALLQRGDDVADVDASAQHVVGVAGAGLDPRHDAPLSVPRPGRVAGLGKAAQNLCLALGPTHPDIVGSRIDEAIEHDIAGEPKNVFDTVVLAPRHRFRAAVMAVATDGDVGLGPVPADTSDQAAEKLADLLARRGLAGTQYHHHRPSRCRIVDMDRQKAALVIMRIPLRQPLVAVHDVDRVVDVQHHRPGGFA